MDITLIVAVVGCVIGVISFFRNGSKDNAEEAQWRGSVIEQLKNISENINELKVLYQTQNAEIKNHEQRITKLEYQRGEK